MQWVALLALNSVFLGLDPLHVRALHIVDSRFAKSTVYRFLCIFCFGTSTDCDGNTEILEFIHPPAAPVVSFSLRRLLKIIPLPLSCWNSVNIMKLSLTSLLLLASASSAAVIERRFWGDQCPKTTVTHWSTTTKWSTSISTTTKWSTSLSVVRIDTQFVIEFLP